MPTGKETPLVWSVEADGPSRQFGLDFLRSGTHRHILLPSLRDKVKLSKVYVWFLVVVVVGFGWLGFFLFVFFFTVSHLHSRPPCRQEVGLVSWLDVWDTYPGR